MLASGNDELERLPFLDSTVECWRCGKRHPVLYGKKVLPDGTRKPSKRLACFHCAGKSYLCGINGKEWRPKGC